MFGLRESDLFEIKEVLSSHKEIQTALIFGSRAKGNFKNGSDVDIALKGENISYRLLLELQSHLNEKTMMPYKFDVIDYNAKSNSDLTEHIDRIGIIFFKQAKSETS